MTAVALALALVAASAMGSGLALLARGRAWAAAGLLVACGVAVLAAALLTAAGRSGAAEAALSLGAGFTPLSLAAYPRVRGRHPLDFLALVTLLGCGLVGSLVPRVWALLLLLAVVVLFAHTWWRLEREDDDDRRAVWWLALSASLVALTAAIVGFLATGAVGGAVAIGIFAVLPPALYVGVAAPGAVDVRAVVVRVVVGGVSLLAYVAACVTVLSLLELLVGRPPAVATSALVGGVLAFGLQPLRVVLRGVVDELLFGSRPDPLDAAGRVVDRMGDDPVLALHAVREALVLPYAALRTPDGALTVSGTPSTETRSFPLEGGGELVVGLRLGDLSLSRDDEHVLRLTVPLLAQTLRARALTAEVRAARGQTVAALEEERRRLRRDLHDGLGPRLSGIAFTADAARNLVGTDPAAADELLRSLRAETGTAIAEIRRIVYAMRPPALDELGLVPALRQQAVGLRSSDGSGLQVTLTAPELPGLPAAVEVAAYRIVVEALANVARHTTSRTAEVRLAQTGDVLAVDVSDVSPSTAPWTPGVGLASMLERATELGGTLVAGPADGGGRVTARLPLSV